VKVIVKLRLLQLEKSITSRMRIPRKNKLDSRRNSQMTVILSSASVAEKVLAMWKEDLCRRGHSVISIWRKRNSSRAKGNTLVHTSHTSRRLSSTRFSRTINISLWHRMGYGMRWKRIRSRRLLQKTKPIRLKLFRNYSIQRYCMLQQKQKRL